jgi:hypothetical protein
MMGWYCEKDKTWSTYKPPAYKCPNCGDFVTERESPPFDPDMVIVYPAVSADCEKKVEK